MSISREDVYYARTNPQALADKLNAIASASGGADDLGTIAELTTTDKTSVVAAINEVVAADVTLLALAGTKAKAKVVAGAAAEAEVAMGEAVASVVAVLAVTTATGAVAAKFLLAVDTDYTVGANKLTMVTDQSANTLIVIYK